MSTLFDQPLDPLPPNPCPHCGEERELYAGAGQAFCIVCEWPAACEAERVYRLTPEWLARSKTGGIIAPAMFAVPEKP